jgi:hypothetical protein
MGNSRKEEAKRPPSLLDLFQTLPLILKLLIAIFGGGTVITVVIVIGSRIQPNPPGPSTVPSSSQPAYTYPAAVQQGWLNDCESRSFNTIPKCQCELSYFENHVSATVYEQDYSEMPPGVVPAQLAGAEACPS